MTFYTLAGATQAAITKGKTCYFWRPIPCQFSKTADGTPLEWVHDPRGTRREYARSGRHADHLIINKTGAATKYAAVRIEQ
jgi:hypothetical protein